MSIQNKPDYKVFASGAKSGEVEAFPDILRGWGVTIDRTGEIPPMEWFNAIGKRTDEWLMYLTQRGVAEWDATLSYPKTAIVQFNSVIYVSIKETKGEQPDKSQASWYTLVNFLGVNNKLDKSEIVQSTGSSTKEVMSQKAVTDAISDSQVNVPDATTSIKGKVKLTNEVSDSEELAMTPKGGAQILSEALSKNVNNIIPPTIPQVNSTTKLLIKTELSHAPLLVITRKAYEKDGYVAMSITNSCAAADESNYGGLSPFRMGEVWDVESVYVGKFGIHRKSDLVNVSSLTIDSISQLVGISGYGDSYRQISKNIDAEINFNNKNVYQVHKDGIIVYKVKGDAILRLGMSSGSSDKCIISISSVDDGNWRIFNTIDLRAQGAGYADIKIPAIIDNQDFYIAIENKTNDSSKDVYVAGINIVELKNITNMQIDYDSALVIKRGSISQSPSNNSMYLYGEGANEFAALDASNNKWFGTFHGGHESLSQRLWTDKDRFNIDNDLSSVPEFTLSNSCILRTSSRIKPVGSSYFYNANTVFSDGASVTQFSLNLYEGAGVNCIRAFTHMCTTSTSFKWVNQPVQIQNKTDNGEMSMGQSSYIEQHDAASGMTVETYFSMVAVDKNRKKGPYIAFLPNYNKQYYGPILDTDNSALKNGSYCTCKVFC